MNATAPALESAPLVPLFRDRFVNAYPKHVGDEAAVQYVPLAAALAEPCATDAHFAAYSRPDIARRLATNLVRDAAHAEALAAGVPMVLAVFDVDDPDTHGTKQPARDEWWAGERAKIERLRVARPDVHVYRTRGGYRIVGVRPEPFVIRTPADDAAWSQQYAAECAYLERVFGIVADRSCADWTRLYRVPRATREGVLENREAIGDPHRVGAWACEPSPADWTNARPTPAAAPVGAGTLRVAATDDPHYWTLVREAEHYADTAPPCIVGEGGCHNRLLAFTRHVRQHFGLPRNDARRMLDRYNARCVPPWSSAELEHKLDATEAPYPADWPHGGWQNYLSPGTFFWPCHAPGNGGDGSVAANDADAPEAEEPPPVRGFPLEALDLSHEPEPIEWAIHKIVATDSVNLLVAAPGSMKTWTLLSMALALATGAPWLGAFQTKRCKVLIVDWESGKRRAHRRLRMLARGDAPDGLFYLRAPGNMQDPKFWNTLRETVEANEIGAVLYDSLAAGSDGVDENSKEAAAPLIAAGHIDGVTHIFIHHAGKVEQKKNAIARGHSAIQAAADTIYRFSDPEGSQADALTCQMLLAKAGDGEQEDRVPLRLTDAGGLQIDTDGVTRVRNDALATAILDLLKSGPKSATQLRGLLGKNNQTVRSELAGLEADGYVVKVDDKYRLDSDESRYGRVLVQMSHFHRDRKVLAEQARVRKEHLDAFAVRGWLTRYKNEFSPPAALPVQIGALGLSAADVAKVRDLFPGLR